MSRNLSFIKFDNEKIYFYISIISSLMIMIWVCWLCQFGYDFADEGFYLVWSQNPMHYPASVSQFGFVYHPFFKYLNENIISFRRLNIVTTYFLATILFFLVLKIRINNAEKINYWKMLVISFALGTSCLIFLRLWLPTPSYNWLTFQGLLVGSIGLLIGNKRSTIIDLISSLLIALSGCIVFMAKPTSAAVLSMIIFGYFILTKIYLKFLYSIIFSLIILITAAFLIDGSIEIFIKRYVVGLN